MSGSAAKGLETLRSSSGRTPGLFRDWLVRVKPPRRTFDKGVEIILDGYPASGIFIITQGWAIRYKILENGARQIINFLLPGDIIGVAAIYPKNSLYTVTALTRLETYRLPKPMISTLFLECPALASAVFLACAREFATLAEHLAQLRRTAEERVSHLLVELCARLRAAGAAGPPFFMPLTQEIIGDAAGLSVVHVNRTLGVLRQAGAIETGRGSVTVCDLEALSFTAAFDGAYLEMPAPPLPVRTEAGASEILRAAGAGLAGGTGNPPSTRDLGARSRRSTPRSAGIART
jgi:CRP-like cAMP-binding protein